MVGKRVDLNNRLRFETISAAKLYFEKILKETPINVHVAYQEFLDISTLYEAYCIRTSWHLNSPPVAFFPMHERGKGYSTRCFAVTFEDGSTNRFSLDKALSAVVV